MPARSSTAGFTTFFTLGEASSDMKIAQPIESGTAKIIDPIVTRTVPTISAKIPYEGVIAVGVHDVPKMKFTIPTCSKIGYPSRNRKKRMNVITITAKKAAQKKTVRMACSFKIE